MPDVKVNSASPRISVLDGLRGVLVTLVVLSHGWTLWPTTGIDDKPALNAWFLGGNFAVSVFFVIGAFLFTRSMIRQGSAGTLRPSVALGRRVVRLGGQMYLVLVVLVVVSVFDSTDIYTKNATTQSVLHAATFTFNWYVQNPLVEARPDIGHLWYLSVDLQVFVLVLALVWFLRHRLTWLIVALAVAFVVLALWRTQIYAENGSYLALLRTAGRADAPIAGALAAAALPFIRLSPALAKVMALVATASLIPLLYITSDLDYFFSVPGLLIDVAAAAMLVGLSLAPAHRSLAFVLDRWPLRLLGRYSLGIYLWHYPVFWFVARHGIEWSWGVRALTGFVILAVMVVFGEVVAERRVASVVGSARWRAMDDGLAAFMIRRTHTQLTSLRKAVRKTS